MKKILFALMVALATTLSFTACSDDDDEITAADFLNTKFEGSIPDIGKCIFSFGASDYQLSGEISESGTYSVANSTITFTASNGNTTSAQIVSKKEFNYLEGTFKKQ